MALLWHRHMILYTYMPNEGMQDLTCESLEEQYKALQDTADEYRAILMSEGYDAEKTKELRTTFDSETEKLRENIVLYKEKQEGIFYLTAEYRSGKRI